MRTKLPIVLTALALLAGAGFIYQASDGADTRKASIGTGQHAPPPDKAADAQAIMTAKSLAAGAAEQGKAGAVEVTDDFPRLETNPEGACGAGLPPNVEILWAKQPRNLQEARAMATQIVVGTVTAIRDIDPVVQAHPGEPGGQDVTPVQQITLRVDVSVKGTNKVGASRTLVRAGDTEGCYRVEGDPAYAKGEKYLLLLEESGQGRPPHTLSPAGRFRVNADGTLQGFQQNQVVAEVGGQPLATVLGQLR